MKRAFISFLFCLAVLAAALTPLAAFADEMTFTRGQVLNHALSVCLDKSDAIAILDTHAKDGHEAAQALWDKKERCSTVPVRGHVVGRIVHSVAVKRDGKELIARAVEIVGDEVLGYFITTSPVNGALPMKKERDS